jgi:ligand-binding sensor domain-containing protein
MKSILLAVYLCSCVAISSALHAGLWASAVPALEGLTHHRWGIGEGLPDQLVLALAKQPDGFLWIGTPHGLVRFDGLRFSEFGIDSTSMLREYGVSALIATKDGSLWAGSVGGGVTHITSTGTVAYGQKDGFRVPRIRSLIQTRSGEIFAGTDVGLYRFQKNSFVQIDEAGQMCINVMVEDGTGGLWLAGSGLLHYVQGRTTSIRLPERRGFIRSAALTQDGKLWLGDPEGLIVIVAGRGPYSVAGFHENVSALHVDLQGQLWIGTITSGLMKLGQRDQPVPVLLPDEHGSVAVRTISTTTNGDLCMAIDLREHFRRIRKETPAISPSTLVVVLRALLCKPEKELIPAEMATFLGYSAMRMRRAFDALEAARLVVYRPAAVLHILWAGSVTYSPSLKLDWPAPSPTMCRRRTSQSQS